MKPKLNTTYDLCLDLRKNKPLVYFTETMYYVEAPFGYKFDGQIFIRKGKK